MQKSKLFWAKHGGGGGSFKTEDEKRREKENQAKELLELSSLEDEEIRLRESLDTINRYKPQIENALQKMEDDMKIAFRSAEFLDGNSYRSYLSNMFFYLEELRTEYEFCFGKLDSDCTNLEYPLQNLKDRLAEISPRLNYLRAKY